MNAPLEPPIAARANSERASSILSDSDRTQQWPSEQAVHDRRARPDGGAYVKQRSLFLEIVDWLLVPLLLLWPVSVGVTFLIARSLADAPFDRALTHRVEVIAQQVRASPGELASSVTQPLPPRSFDPSQPADEHPRVQVVAADGSLLAGDPSLPPPALGDFAENEHVRLRNEQIDGRDLRVAYTHVELTVDGKPQPVLIQIGESLAERNRLANEIIKGVIFPQFVILPGVILLVWFGLKRGLAPLESLHQRICQRSPDDTSPIDAHGTPEEVGPLIDAFNELLERQTRSVRAQKRFIADAAHQIKTPLAGLQTQAELALRSRDPADVRRSLEQLLRSSGRAARMVSQLLAMARTEHQGESLVLTRLDLTALAREVIGQWVPAALGRNIDISFEAPEAALGIDGHALLLRELLNNLLDNALRYTPPGGSVAVRVASGRAHNDPSARTGIAADTVLLEVLDTGPGIPESDRELVFERFYRVPGTQADGSGLGLSIVRAIARQHGATVSVTPNPRCAPRQDSSGTPRQQLDTANSHDTEPDCVHPGRASPDCAVSLPGARFVLELTRWTSAAGIPRP